VIHYTFIDIRFPKIRPLNFSFRPIANNRKEITLSWVWIFHFLCNLHCCSSHRFKFSDGWAVRFTR